jgi:hypothetical protein
MHPVTDRMHPRRRLLFSVNVLGGAAVLGSYAYFLGTRPDASEVLWGNVPVSLRGLYSVGMIAATVGYFAFAQYLFFRADPQRARFGRLTYAALPWVFLAILAPSAAWMPLTFAHAASPGPLLWLGIRGVLALVGFGSMALVAMLLGASERSPTWSWRLAVVGGVAFAFQTAVLDAIVWPHLYLAP